jgi:hypothetical protein
MTTRTRYFVIVSLLVLVVGLGTGLVAYYVGLPTSAFTRQGGPDELRYVPQNVAVLAYADVHQVMTSDLRRALHAAAPVPENGQREFRDKTGIDIERDIDSVVAAAEPAASAGGNGSGMVLARGRFDAVRIESLVREHGGTAEDYNGKKLLLVHNGDRGERSELALSFLEPGLVAVGTAPMVRAAIDLGRGGASVTANTEMMNLVRSLDNGNAWAVGSFDALRGSAKLPDEVASRLPPITWFSISSYIDGGIRGVVRAETSDEQAAGNLRDVVRGFLALMKMQTGNNPGLQVLSQSLQLGGTGKTVALSFDVPAAVFETLGHRGARQGER